MRHSPQLLQAAGLLILIIVSLLARQTALAVICLLALIAFVGWRLATYDWTPMEPFVEPSNMVTVWRSSVS